MELSFEAIGTLFEETMREHGANYCPYYVREKIGEMYLEASELPGLEEVDREQLMRIDKAFSWTGLFQGADMYDVTDSIERVRWIFGIWAEGYHYLAMHWDRLPDCENKRRITRQDAAQKALTVRHLITAYEHEPQESEPIMIEHEIFHLMENNLTALYGLILGDERAKAFFDRVNNAVSHLRRHTEIHNAMHSLDTTDLPLM